MDRRAFAAGAVAAFTMPLAAGAQPLTKAVVGFLSSLKAYDQGRVIPPFHRGLGETGYFEGGNLTIEYRWAEGEYERLPSLAADLVRRHVLAIAALSGTPAGLAAKAATATIPASSRSAAIPSQKNW
jgi:putative ABC transport system substrate-binding protein